MTDDELHRSVLEVLDGPGRKLLRELLDVYPSAMSRGISGATGYSERSSGFENALGKLRSLGFIEYPERGTARVRDILFPKRPT